VQFGVAQFKELLVLQFARVRIRTALLLSCVWAAEAFIVPVFSSRVRYSGAWCGTSRESVASGRI
jgi:hypothetical protein